MPTPLSSPSSSLLSGPHSFQRNEQKKYTRMLTLCREGQQPPASFKRSVFLISADGTGWEAVAINALIALGFDQEDSVLFIGPAQSSHVSQWSAQMREISDAIVCYVPPGTEKPAALQMAWPALLWADSGKLVCGASNCSWVDEALAPSVFIHSDLQQTIVAAWQKVSKGALRSGAERSVPLMVWLTMAWKSWYSNLLAAGNELHGAKLSWTFRVGPGGAFVLFWAVLADIFVASEQRNKSNEVVIARPDIACVLAYMPGVTMMDTELILIKEFRSPCRNEEMFVFELPGGSSFSPTADVFQTAADELLEEAGIVVDKERLEKQTNRQAAATALTHHVHLFSCELTPDEMDAARKNANTGECFGNDSESERTYVVTMQLREAITSSRVDLSTLGMIMQTIGLFFDHKSKKELLEMQSRLAHMGLDTDGMEGNQTANTIDKVVVALDDVAQFDEHNSSAKYSYQETAIETLMLGLEEERHKCFLLKQQLLAQQQENAQLKEAATPSTTTE